MEGGPIGVGAQSSQARLYRAVGIRAIVSHQGIVEGIPSLLRDTGLRRGKTVEEYLDVKLHRLAPCDGQREAHIGKAQPIARFSAIHGHHGENIAVGNEIYAAYFLGEIVVARDDEHVVVHYLILTIEHLAAYGGVIVGSPAIAEGDEDSVGDIVGIRCREHFAEVFMLYNHHIVGRTQLRYRHSPYSAVGLPLCDGGHSLAQSCGIEKNTRVGGLTGCLGEGGMGHFEAETPQHVGIHRRAAVGAHRGELRGIADKDEATPLAGIYKSDEVVEQTV